MSCVLFASSPHEVADARDGGDEVPHARDGIGGVPDARHAGGKKRRGKIAVPGKSQTSVTTHIILTGHAQHRFDREREAVLT